MPLVKADAAPHTSSEGTRQQHSSTPPPTPLPTDRPPATGAGQPNALPVEAVQFTTASYTTKTRATGESPVGLSLYYPQPLWAGQPAELQLQIRNLVAKPVEQMEISGLSRAFPESLTEGFAVLPGHEMLRLPLRFKPAAAGQFLLTFTLKLKIAGQWKNFIGARVIWVNPLPQPENYPLAPERIRINRGERGMHLQELWAEAGSPAARPLTAWPEVQALRLPEVFEPVELALDYQLSVSAFEELRQRQELLIPRLFVTNAQTGTKLKLTPANPEEGRGIHLVARPAFKIGRSRLDSDLAAWFWPRSHAHDERTRHLSRIHVLLEIREGRPMLRDAGSVGGSNYDGQPLAADRWEPMVRRATLVMAGEYFLEINPAPGDFGGDLVIKNLKVWSGPQTSAPPALRGAIHFTPINTAPAHHDAVWLFSDAAFGTSRSNAIVLPEDQGVGEVQGRFYYAHGAFWLESVARNEAVRVNYHSLSPGEIAPLINGQLVQLGRIHYHAEILP